MDRRYVPDPAMASRFVRRGRKLRRLPVVAEAWEEGSIAAPHVDLMIGLVREATQYALARDESMLVTQAKGLRFKQFASTVAYWDQLADPDGTEEAAEPGAPGVTSIWRHPSTGMFLGKMTLDPISGSIVSGSSSE